MARAKRKAIGVTARASPQIRDRNLRGGEFDGMADIPFLKLPRVGLQVELKRKRVASIGERLILVVWFDASLVASRGRSNVSPCQCRTTASSPCNACRQDDLPSPVKSTVPQPISLMGPLKTRLPSALAISWLPRQIPSVGRSRDNLYSISEISDVRNG